MYEMVLIRRQEHCFFSLVATTHHSPSHVCNSRTGNNEAWTHYLAYKPSLGGENNYVPKVIVNTGEYCKTTLKLFIDISEAPQFHMNKIIIISWFIESQQAQHAQLHDGGLDGPVVPG